MNVSHRMTSGASQYGVPMNVPLLSYVFLFLAETPKSAVDENRKKLPWIINKANSQLKHSLVYTSPFEPGR